MGRTPKKLMLGGTRATPRQMKPKIVRAPSPDITAFRTSRRPKNPVTVDKNLPVDTFVHSPQIALEPETFDVPSNEALAASIELEIGKGSSLDDVVNSSAELLSMDLTYLDVGPISLTEDPQLELSGLLPSNSNPTDIAREVLNCLANGDLNECEEKEGDGRGGSTEEGSDESSNYDNESCVGSSTGDLTTEESESDYEEHIVGLNKLQENSRTPERLSSKKTSTFTEAETVSLDSCDEDINETSNLRVRGDKNQSPHIPSNNPSISETKNSEPLNDSSDFCQFSQKDTSVSSPQKNPAAESAFDSADFISDKSSPSQANSNKFKFSKSSPSPCSSPSSGYSKNELKSPKPNRWEATPPGESSPEKPDSSLPQATRSPDEFQKNNPSTNFSENFADYMSLSSLGSFGSSLYFSKETVPNLVTFKREVPLEGESDPFADMGINLEDLVQVCATPADIITDPSAPPLYPFPSADGSQSFSTSCDRDSRSCSTVENYDSIPVQSSTLSTSSGNLLLDNLGQLHKSVGTSPKSSALFGVPLVISAQRSTAVEISDCHVSSTQECSATNINDDNTSSSTSSPRKRHSSQIVTNRSDDESDDEVVFISRQQLVDPLARDIEEISEVAQEIISRSDVEPMESRNEIQSTTHASVENETNEIVPSFEQLNTPITLHPLTSTGDIYLKSSGKEIFNYANENSLSDNAGNPKPSQPRYVPVDSHFTKQLEKVKEVPLVVCSNDHSSNAKNSIDVLSESQQESHIEVESVSIEPDKRKPVEGAASSISSTQKELTVVESIQEHKKRRPGPASKTRTVVEPSVPDSPKHTPVTSLMTSSKISEEEASSTSTTLEIATVKFSIPSKPDHLSVVPMKPLNASPCKNSRMWLYSAEHKLSLYEEGKFLVDREHLRNYEDNSIPVWRIWKTRKLLQKFVPIEIDRRCFHQGVDEFRLFPDVEDELYIKYQPIIFDVWIDTKSHQLGIYYNVIGSYPYLGYFPLTVQLHDDFKDFLLRMACRAMSDKVKRNILARKDNETFQDVINSHLKEIIVAECFPQAFPVEVLIQAIEYPRMINTRSQVKKNVSCCSCQRMGKSKQSYFTAVFDGDLYDHVTFHLTKKEGHGKQSALQFCRLCTKYLIAFHRIVHYKFWLFIAFRLQLRKLYLELKQGQKFHPDDVLKFLTGDFHFNKMCFYEFQAVYSEGYHSKDRLQKEIILLGKKQKGPSDPFRNTSDSTECIKTFQKSIKGLFYKPRNPQLIHATPTLCLETTKVTPVKTGLENQAKGRKQVKRKKLLDEPQKQPETELPGSLHAKDLYQDHKKSTALKSGSHLVDNSSTKDCESRKAPTKKSRKRDLSKSDGKVLNSQLMANGQIGTCETPEIVSKTPKKAKLSTSTVFVPNKAMLKQTTHLEPADSTSSSSTKRSKSNKEKPSEATKNKARVASPSSSAMGPPPKRKKVQEKNKRQPLNSGKSTRGKIAARPTSSSRDSEMDMVIETTKEISDFMEQFQQVSDVSTEDAVAKVSSDASLGQHEEEGVFELLSIEFVS